MSRRGRPLLQRGAPGGVGRGYASHLVSIRGQDVPTFLILCCVTLIVSSVGAYSYDRYMIKKAVDRGLGTSRRLPEP